MKSRSALAAGLAVAVALWLALVACDSAATDPNATGGGTPTPKPAFDAGVILEEFPAGGPRNEVRLENRQNGRFMARGSIKLQRIGGDIVQPQNIAFAQGSCTDCQTIAVAIQVAVYRRGATNVQPVNVAVAANVGCTRCVTVARAIQYAIPLDDPNAVPDDVVSLVHDMNREMKFFASVTDWHQLTTADAQARLQRIVDQYAELKQFLLDLTDQKTADDASPSPSASPSSSAPSSAAPATATPAGSTPAPTATP